MGLSSEWVGKDWKPWDPLSILLCVRPPEPYPEVVGTAPNSLSLDSLPGQKDCVGDSESKLI